MMRSSVQIDFQMVRKSAEMTIEVRISCTLAVRTQNKIKRLREIVE